MRYFLNKERMRLFGLFGLALLTGGGLLHVSQMVHNAQERVSALEARIAAERDAIHVLRAEWAYLNSPARLEMLAAEHLDLQAPGAEQMMRDVRAIRPHDGARDSAREAHKRVNVKSVVLVSPPKSQDGGAL